MAENSLAKTTAIYFIGNFASKLLIFFLLPLYTSRLSTADYGIVDLLISLLPLIGPVFTLQATESVFRFLFDKKTKQEKKKCISSAMAVMLCGILMFLILFYSLKFDSLVQYGNYFAIYFVATYLGTFLQQVARGLNKSFEYAISGVLSTVVSASLNILLIVGFNFHGEALLIASICASVLLALYLINRTKLFQYLSVSCISFDEISEQIKYGLPLIPNQICWWALSLFGKYIILFYQGASSTGILAFANIFPNAITVITQIFFLAWVESAIRSYNKDESGKYYSDAFRSFCPLVLSVATVLLPIVGIYTDVTISGDYQEGLLYIPLLMAASVFNCFASFLGSAYTVAKKTLSAFSTTVIAAIVNIVISFLLIPDYGLWGYSLATFTCYLVLFLIRIKSIARIIPFRIEMKQIIIGAIFYSTSCFFYYFEDLFVYIVVAAVFSVLAVAWNMKLIKQLLAIIGKDKK